MQIHRDQYLEALKIRHDKDGITMMSLYDFLLLSNSLEL